MSKAIENKINKIYKEIFKKVFTKERISELSKGNRTSIEFAIMKLKSKDKYKEFCNRFATALAKSGLNNQKGIWRKYFEAAKASHHIALPKTFKEFELNALKKVASQNFEMIKSIPDKIMETMNQKYVSALIEEVAKGSLPRGSFKKELQKHENKNAGVIARTEAAKIQTAVMENRAIGLGSAAYEWLSSNDKRTRPSHREMNGVIVFWRKSNLEKPLLDNMYGNAGEFPNCRCSPEPVFDEEDLQNSSYKVYDYKQRKVVTMKREELIEKIKKGSLY